MSQSQPLDFTNHTMLTSNNQSSTDLTMQQAARLVLEQQARQYIYNLLTQQARDKSLAQIGSLPEAEVLIEEAMAVINRNNEIADLLYGEQSDFPKLVEEKLTLMGNSIKIGLGFCVDGRFSTIFLAGRFASATEVPAGEIAVFRRDSDGALIPVSADLNMALKQTVDEGEPNHELLEIFFAHGSLSEPHRGCAAIGLTLTALQSQQSDLDNAQSDEIEIKESLARKAELEAVLSKQDIQAILIAPTPEDANLLLLEKTSLKAVDNIYNIYRKQANQEEVKQVGVTAFYDSDTMGIVLNYAKRDTGNYLSTTELVNRYRQGLEQFDRGNLGYFGSEKDTFTKHATIVEFSRKILNITKVLLNKHIDYPINQLGEQICQEINDKIKVMYPDLSLQQKQGLAFFIARTMAFQYLTGLSSFTDYPNYAFAKHLEEYLAVSMRGEFVGQFDTHQAFGYNAVDGKTAVDRTKIALAVMQKNNPKSTKPRLLFVCSSIAQEDAQSKNKSILRAKANNQILYKELRMDPTLATEIARGRLVLLPVLVEENTRKVLRIVDQSAVI